MISSVLKQFFQKLPDPLFTSEFYPFFIEASKIEDPKQRMLELKKLVSLCLSLCMCHITNVNIFFVVTYDFTGLFVYFLCTCRFMSCQTTITRPFGSSLCI